MATISVRLKSTSGDEARCDDARPSQTVGDLLLAVEGLLDKPVKTCVFHGRPLDEAQTLRDCGVGEGALLIVIPAKAGPRRKPPALYPQAKRVANSASGGVRGALRANPELLSLLGLPPELGGGSGPAGGGGGDLSQADMQQVLVAGCGLLLRTSAGSSQCAGVLGLLHAAPWELCAMHAVLAMQDREAVVAHGHGLLGTLRWGAIPEPRRAELLAAVCGPRSGLRPEGRPYLLQRMMLGHPAVDEEAATCVAALAKRFLQQGHVNDLISALESDSFSGPKFLARQSDAPGVMPLLRFMLLVRDTFAHSLDHIRSQS